MQGLDKLISSTKDLLFTRRLKEAVRNLQGTFVGIYSDLFINDNKDTKNILCPRILGVILIRPTPVAVWLLRIVICAWGLFIQYRHLNECNRYNSYAALLHQRESKTESRPFLRRALLAPKVEQIAQIKTW